MTYSTLNLKVRTATVAKKIAQHRGMTLGGYITMLIEADARAFSLAGEIYGFAVDPDPSGGVRIALDDFPPRVCTVAEARSFAEHLTRVARFGGVLVDFDAPGLSLGRRGSAVTVEDTFAPTRPQITISVDEAMALVKLIEAAICHVEAAGETVTS